MPSYSFYPIDEPGIVAAESLFTLESPKKTQKDASFSALEINSRLPFAGKSLLEPKPLGFALIEDDSDSVEASESSESTRRSFSRNKRYYQPPSSNALFPSEYDVSCKRQRTSSLLDYARDGNQPGGAANANRCSSMRELIGEISRLEHATSKGHQ
jgi:hypothetical protein